MKKLHTADNMVILSHLKNVLEAAGVPCLIRNQFLSGAMGEVPPHECWPELWVVNNIDLLKARAVLSEFMSNERLERPDWICHGCGEAIEGQFGQCWRCGALEPGVAQAE